LRVRYTTARAPAEEDSEDTNIAQRRKCGRTVGEQQRRAARFSLGLRPLRVLGHWCCVRCSTKHNLEERAARMAAKWCPPSCRNLDGHNHRLSNFVVRRRAALLAPLAVTSFSCAAGRTPSAAMQNALLPRGGVALRSGSRGACSSSSRSGACAARAVRPPTRAARRAALVVRAVSEQDGGASQRACYVA
jgi:hypothetical protein